MRRVHKVARIAASGWVTFFVALIIASPVIYWGLDRASPVVVHNFELFPKEVRPGETIYRQISVTRIRSCTTSVDIIIKDGKRVRWIIDEPEIADPGPIRIRETYTVPVIIPPAAAPGPAEMRFTVTRKCNPLHEFFPLVSRNEPIQFTILHHGAKGWGG